MVVITFWFGKYQFRNKKKRFSILQFIVKDSGTSLQGMLVLFRFVILFSQICEASVIH